MKTVDRIPVGKLARTTELLKTGAKVGTNYVKYYGQKLLDSKTDRSTLDENNAADIYDGLKNLKGSALKVAQMLSMDKSILPGAYVEKFSLAQFNVPALSAPLVRRTFKRYSGQFPEEIFESFSKESIHAASIGQVHKARLNNQDLAVKIQYPGVAESVSSDLAMVKPVAIKMFNLKGKDSERYFAEVESKLLEETDYELELQQSKRISEACQLLNNLVFPKYYSDLSNERILVMDWIEGQHLSEYVVGKTEIPQHLGQALWNFYMFQMHGLREVHADPHPGNFKITPDDQLAVIDFGCIKQVPEDFYQQYFMLAQAHLYDSASSKAISGQVTKENRELENIMRSLEILRDDDTPEQVAYFKNLFTEMLQLFTLPFRSEKFDFADPEFWNKITALSQKFSKDKTLRKMNGNRGSKHFLYINRTFFGLFNLLNDLKANVKIYDYVPYLEQSGYKNHEVLGK